MRGDEMRGRGSGPRHERPRVVHVTGDFPDPVEPAKTAVIRRLVDLTGDRFEHRVVSLNRRSPRWLRFAADVLARPAGPGLGVERADFDYGETLIYRAPGRGLYHAAMLRALGERLAASLRADPPDLLVGHKLTIEGIAVERAARLLGTPYALSIQGDTDLKILRARPDLRPLLRRVFHGAAVVFPFAPWALEGVEAALGPRSGPSLALPCPTELDRPITPRPGGSGLLTMFHLASYRRKNLTGIVRAARILESEGRAIPLKVAGGGSAADERACRAIVGGTRSVALAGPLGREEVAGALNAAAGFVLPSHRESFGLVFVEALFAGAPIIYPQGQAVSGYFDGQPFAIPVRADDPHAIAMAMKRLIDDQTVLKTALEQWQTSSAAQRFTRAAIGDAFAAGLDRAIAAREAPAS